MILVCFNWNGSQDLVPFLGINSLEKDLKSFLGDFISVMEKIYYATTLSAISLPLIPLGV